jgi:anti-anti-sigma factor
MIQQDLVIDKQYVDEKKVTVLSLKGQLDAHTFNMLENAIDDIFASECYRIIFRLEQLEYIASAGMGVFISTRARA